MCRALACRAVACRAVALMLLLPAGPLGQVVGPMTEQSAKLDRLYSPAAQGNYRHRLASASALAVSRSGAIFVLDGGNSRVVKLDRRGRFLSEFGGPGHGPGRISTGGLSDSLAVDADENVYVPDPVNPRVQIFDRGGKLVRTFRVPFAIDSVAVNSVGEILLAPNASRADALVYVFSNEGNYLRSFGRRLVAATGSLSREVSRVHLAVDARDNVFLAFRSWPLVRKYSRAGRLLAESAFKVSSTLVRERELKNYSLDFIEKHPNAAFVLPLLTHSVSADAAGAAYLLLNGNVIVKVSRDGRVVKQNRLRDEAGRHTFIRLGLDRAAGLLLLLDTLDSNIYALPRAPNAAIL
jgi:hypothetical protein